jgi:CDP-6-deoxy-D-xylo-4-hexulose-3-dehydrase
LTKHPCFDELREKREGYRIVPGREAAHAEDLPVTDEIMNSSFWVGVYPGLTSGMIDFMIEKIKDL